MKKFLCYLLTATILITSCMGCAKQTKETDKKGQTKVEKTDTQEKVSNTKEDKQNDVEEDTSQLETNSDETASNTKEESSKKEQNNKQTTSQTNKQQNSKKNNTQNNTSSNKQNNTNSNKQNNTTQSEESKHKHKYTKTVTNPTCTDKGYTTYSCGCGDSYKDNYTTAKGHTAVIDKAVPATTTSTGLTEGKHCSVCGAIVKKQEAIPTVDVYVRSISVDKAGQTIKEGDLITIRLDADFKESPKKFYVSWYCIVGNWKQAKFSYVDGVYIIESTFYIDGNQQGTGVLSVLQYQTSYQDTRLHSVPFDEEFAFRVIK